MSDKKYLWQLVYEGKDTGLESVKPVVIIFIVAKVRTFDYGRADVFVPSMLREKLGIDTDKLELTKIERLGEV